MFNLSWNHETWKWYLKQSWQHCGLFYMASSRFCSDAVVETSLTAQLQSLQPHYVTGGRKIDMLLCSLYIQHWRGGNTFVSPSLSLFTGIQHALWTDTTYKVLVKTALSVLWPYKMHIFFNPFHMLGKVNRGTWNIYSPSPGSIIQSLCTESSNISSTLCWLASTHFKRVYESFKIFWCPE